MGSTTGSPYYTARACYPGGTCSCAPFCVCPNGPPNPTGDGSTDNNCPLLPTPPSTRPTTVRVATAAVVAYANKGVISRDLSLRTDLWDGNHPPAAAIDITDTVDPDGQNKTADLIITFHDQPDIETGNMLSGENLQANFIQALDNGEITEAGGYQVVETEYGVSSASSISVFLFMLGALLGAFIL